MKKLFTLLSVGLILSLLAACAPAATSTPVANAPTAAPSLTKPTAPSTDVAPTVAPAATDTMPAPAPTADLPTFLDDRSTPGQVILSFFNAIERREYARAYYYWNDSEQNAGPFEQFSKLLEGVKIKEIILQPISSSGAAGSIYNTIPGTLSGELNGKEAVWAFCYVTRLPQPGNYGEPPIHPRTIDRGRIIPIDGSTDLQSALTLACADYETGGETETAQTPSLDISKGNFVDNRSGAIEIVSSYLNAINLKQYVRAYSYFAAPEDFPGNFDAFQAGYAQTETVTAEFGEMKAGAAAGNRYYSLPAHLTAILKNGTVQHFTGCYVIHQSAPELFASPPFVPMGIQLGRFFEAAPSADFASLLRSACDNLP